MIPKDKPRPKYWEFTNSLTVLPLNALLKQNLKQLFKTNRLTGIRRIKNVTSGVQMTR